MKGHLKQTCGGRGEILAGSWSQVYRHRQLPTCTISFLSSEPGHYCAYINHSFHGGPPPAAPPHLPISHIDMPLCLVANRKEQGAGGGGSGINHRSWGRSVHNGVPRILRMNLEPTTAFMVGHLLLPLHSFLLAI